MSEKKSRPSDCSTRTAGLEKAPGTASISCLDCTTNIARLQVSDFLRYGQKNAIPLKALRGILHLPARTIRLMIRRERLSGVPILSDNLHGYYLLGNDCERAQCVQSLERRAAEVLKVAAAIERGKE